MTKPRDIIERLRMARGQTGDTRVARAIDDAIGDIEEMEDPYTMRVRRFHEALREHGDEDYLAVYPHQIDEADLPLPPETSSEVVGWAKRVVAERNRLFWAAFLAEETGEVASALVSGEPPEDFEEEDADVNILTHAIADVFEFDMLEAFHDKMDENDRKPLRQEGTGKLPAEARDQWG